MSLRKLMFFCICGTVLFGVVGCALVRESLRNYEACKGDVECVAKMQRLHDLSASVASVGVDVVPFSFPFSDKVIEGIAVLCAALGGIMYGKKVQKGKKDDIY